MRERSRAARTSLGAPHMLGRPQRAAMRMQWEYGADLSAFSPCSFRFRRASRVFFCRVASQRASSAERNEAIVRSLLLVHMFLAAVSRVPGAWCVPRQHRAAVEDMPGHMPLHMLLDARSRPSRRPVQGR